MSSEKSLIQVLISTDKQKVEDEETCINIDSSDPSHCQTVEVMENQLSKYGTGAASNFKIINIGDGKFRVTSPDLNFTLYFPMFDMVGNRMGYAILREKRDLEFVLSWLSTLGGACSAMGDCSTNWVT